MQIEKAQPLVPAETVVAIDGPAGSGKSTTARALAERLGLLYVDTGAMYRALTWAAQQAGIAVSDETNLVQLLRESDLRLESRQRETLVYWNGRDISAVIRTPEIEADVSAVSAHSDVRIVLVEKQRQFGRKQGVVMEGRDIGSVVFPLADAKIFLDASLEARTQRRLRQHQRNNTQIDVAELRQEMQERDRKDSERAQSPLTIPPDAIVIDNSDMTLGEQLDITTEAVLQIIEQKQPSIPSPGSPSANLTFRYRVAYGIMSVVGDFCGMKVYDRHWADMDEGKIIAPNHVSNWDPPMLATALRNIGHCRSIAKEELFRPLWGKLMYNFLHAVPIKRSIYDSHAFDRAAEYLGEGQNIVFFPEGMRRVFGSPGPVRNGLGMLMQRTGAAAVPIFFRGTTAPEPGGSSRSPLEARFAPPVRLHALPSLRERMSEREINQSVSNLFRAIYIELQDRSFAAIPMTEWEMEIAAKQESKVRRKEAKTFKRRQNRAES
jgi:CMP/dCMP kinase